MPGVVTFDFHNTLAQCDAWFDLEVRHLVSALLRWHAVQEHDAPDTALLAQADVAYRELRAHVVANGHELTAEACVAHVCKRLGVPIDGATVSTGVQYLMRETLASTEPIPGAIETVRALGRANVCLGVVSSAVYHPFLEWTLAKFGLRDAFANVTTSASAGFYKSRPEVFWHAVDALGATAKQSVHVGDSFRFDIGGAQRAGLGTVWLRSNPDAPSGGAPSDGETPDLTLTTLHGAAKPILDLLRSRSA